MASGYQNEQSRQQQLNKSKLVVRIIEARGIKAADFGGTSDPYVEVRIKGQSTCVKTRTIKKTLNPCWNEELIVYPTNIDYDIVNVKLYDYDSTSNNDLLGELEFPVALCVNKPPTEEWKQIMVKKGPTTFAPGKGEIKLSCQYVDPSKPAATTTATPAAAPYPGATAPGYPAQPAPGYTQYPPAPSATYPAAPGYPPQSAPGYPPQQPGYPPQPAPGYPPQPTPGYGQYPQPTPGYAPAPGYPPQPTPGYGAYPTQAYPPQPTPYGAPAPGYGAPQYPPQSGYPPQYPPQQPGYGAPQYPPQQPGYPGYYPPPQ